MERCLQAPRVRLRACVSHVFPPRSRPFVRSRPRPPNSSRLSVARLLVPLGILTGSRYVPVKHKDTGRYELVLVAELEGMKKSGLVRTERGVEVFEDEK